MGYLGQVKYFDPADNPPPAGRLDVLVRRFNGPAYALAVLALYLIAAVAVGLAAVPSLMLVEELAPAMFAAARWWSWPLLGVLFGVALFLWGLMLLVVVPIFNFVLPTRLRPFNGGYFTIAAVPWYLHNGLFYLVRFTVLPFVTLTPLAILFLRAMGMHMGRRPRITTEFLTDVSMITLGDDVAIGGSASIFCHYGGAGHLVIAPVTIGSRVAIGEKATVMGDVRIGDGATILAHSVLLPGTRVGPGERWGGVPARPISHQEWEAYKALTGTGQSASRSVA